MDVPALEIVDLRKDFGTTRVLDGIDLVVGPGQVVGYIGPNGAGKSTTIRILTGLLDGFSGTAKVDGVDVRIDPIEVKRRIGYVPENAQLYDALSMGEHLQLVARLHGLPDEVGLRRATALMDAFGLVHRMRVRIGALSKGQRQKVLLASALLHDPKVLFLDEPLSGLDVASTMLVKALIRTLADRGKTVFYSSHMMDVVERVCDRIVILSGGRVVADGSYEELAAARAGGSLESIFAELTGTGGEQVAADAIADALGMTA
ncbi:MAG: ABC transporter ATP-binding protein [Planctomycetes bacterium]|nr:ABC transporter ATP-binding protein [Planctomycetota bacterium]